MADATPISSVTSQWDLFDALGDGIYGVDPDGLCTFVNKAALRMLGYVTAADLLGRNMHSMIHHTRPDGSPFPQAQCPLLHTAQSGHPVRLQNEMLWRKDGSPFFAEYSSFPVFTDGSVTGSVITFSDTSVRQDAQKRLAVQYAVSQILAGTAAEIDVPALLLEAVGMGLAWLHRTSTWPATAMPLRQTQPPLPHIPPSVRSCSAGGGRFPTHPRLGLRPDASRGAKGRPGSLIQPLLENVERHGRRSVEDKAVACTAGDLEAITLRLPGMSCCRFRGHRD